MSREHAIELFRAAVDAVRPEPLVRAALESDAVVRNAPRVIVVGAGKAGAGMAAGLEAALAQARNSGLQPVTTQAAEGQAAQEIVRLAAERGVDCIVMGTRGMNALGGLLLGSVAQRVVHLASVPVMLVK